MDQQMENTMDGKMIPMTSVTSGIGQEVSKDVYCLPIQIVNTVFVGNPEHWALVDAGMPESADRIIAHAEDRFGSGCRPKAIILTHGHFDHVGALIDLVNEWRVPVYAHQSEMPYLTGQSNYPEPDGSVEGGLIAKIAPTFPNQGTIWKNIFTPSPTTEAYRKWRAGNGSIRPDIPRGMFRSSGK